MRAVGQISHVTIFQHPEFIVIFESSHNHVPQCQLSSAASHHRVHPVAIMSAARAFVCSIMAAKPITFDRLHLHMGCR